MSSVSSSSDCLGVGAGGGGGFGGFMRCQGVLRFEMGLQSLAEDLEGLAQAGVWFCLECAVNTLYPKHPKP